MTPEKLALLEAEAAAHNEDITAPGEGPEAEPYLKPVKAGRRVELDEDASPTAGRRFTRT